MQKIWQSLHKRHAYKNKKSTMRLIFQEESSCREKAENLLIQNSSLSKIKIAAAEGKDELVATSYGGDYSGQEDNFYVDDLSIGLLDKHIEFLRTKGFGVLMLGVESGRPTLTISW
jgi:hypothetical protein